MSESSITDELWQQGINSKDEDFFTFMERHLGKKLSVQERKEALEVKEEIDRL